MQPLDLQSRVCSTQQMCRGVFPCYRSSQISATMEEGTKMYTVLGIATCIVLLFLNFRNVDVVLPKNLPQLGFVERNGTQFLVDGKPLYINGWNSYWLMDQSVESSNRHKVRTLLRKASAMGLTVVRTWAFNDGGYNALQIRPGVLNERVFRALDFVLAEARINGVRVILSLANNLKAYGGKVQYVKWAHAAGVNAGSSNDTFFSNPTVKGYYKDYVKAILTRKNSISGIEYRYEPAIFAWELMNEPRCISDPSGNTLQAWISEMGKFVKSLDSKHLVTVGIEGFYGHNILRAEVNPGEWASLLGSDFIHDSQVEYIDFASVHAYPDSWIKNANLKETIKFLSNWVTTHIEDAENKLGKPVLFTEFGISSTHKGFQISHRDIFLKTMFDKIYKSARKNGAGAGALVWQYLVENMDEYGDEYAFVPWQVPSTYRMIAEQSCRLKRLRDPTLGNIEGLCSKLKNR